MDKDYHFHVCYMHVHDYIQDMYMYLHEWMIPISQMYVHLM